MNGRPSPLGSKLASVSRGMATTRKPMAALHTPTAIPSATDTPRRRGAGRSAVSSSSAIDRHGSGGPYCAGVRRIAVVPALLLSAVTVVVAGCSDDTTLAQRRAEQVRSAADEAGLEADVVDFLALAVQGDTATYRVVYPGTTEGSELVVTNRPPQRRVDGVVDGAGTETRIITDGQAHTCLAQVDGGWRCQRTDAFVEPIGLFGPDAVDDMVTALVERSDEFTYVIDAAEIAGSDATCLVTTRREGADPARAAASASLCVSREGVMLRVERGADVLEATSYSTEVPDDSFALPDGSTGAATSAP